jgi:hypothetical protein
MRDMGFLVVSRRRNRIRGRNIDGQDRGLRAVTTSAAPSSHAERGELAPAKIEYARYQPFIFFA